MDRTPASQKLPDLQAKRCPWHGMRSIMAVLNEVVFVRDALAEGMISCTFIDQT